MSVDVGMGIGRGHVTLGHGGNVNTTATDANHNNQGGQTSPPWSVQCWDTLDQVDHLILLPERALTMDSGWLQADLAEILAHSVIGHGRGGEGVTPFLSHTERPSSRDGSDSWSPSRRRSLDWSLVNPTGQHSPSFVAIASSSDPGQEGCATTAAAAAAAAASAIQREERSKVLRERQNEERQRKLEELKQHALATQKFREQQEEERRRRMEEQRLRDLERRTQVEERKKAILEAERERREAMLRRSEDRGMRQELKRRNERGSIAFAFGSSTPRMLEPVDSCSSYWGSRRATSTTNVMSTSNHGRVTMNEVNTPSGGANNKRAASVFGLDQNQDDRMTQSVRQVLDWEVAGRRRASEMTSSTTPRDGDILSALGQHHHARWSAGRPHHASLFGAGCFLLGGEDLMTQSTSAVQGGRRKRTDLIPTIPIHRGDGDRSPRSPLYASSSGASSSRGSVSRSTGMSMSLSRLDQLSQPRRRLLTSQNSNPSSSPLQPLHETDTNLTANAAAPNKPGSARSRRPSRSSHVTSSPATTKARSMSKSMSHLAAPKTATTPSPPSAVQSVDVQPRMTRAERLRLKARQASQRPHGLRSGDITPSSPTRPLSALSHVSSVSTTVASSSSVSGHVRARTAPAGGRKPRPISIAGTGMSLGEAARTTRASRENISRERSKETKEKENERTRQTQPRPARARSADMRKDNNNVSGSPQQSAATKSPEAQPQPSNAKRTRDTRPTSSRDARTPVKAEPTTRISAKSTGQKAEEVKPKVAIKVDDVAVKAEPEKQEIHHQDAAQQLEETSPSVDKVEENVDVQQQLSKTTDQEMTMDSLASEDNTTATEASLPRDDDIDSPVPPQPDVTSVVGQAVVDQPSEMTTSGTTTPSEGSVSGDAPSQSRKIISSEEEAKAALAEKRRLAREQMEREAERERLRAEEERRLEEERLRQEELEQKLAEEEMDRLAMEARLAEAERLQKAIEETQRREEEERVRREEEARLRAEKEVQERKAREEAEKLRKENEERLRREEEERQERRRRVEAIMSRTRGKSGGPGKSELNPAGGGQSTTDVNTVGMSNSISQPDLLGDIVNKTNGGGSIVEQSSPDDDAVDTKKNNGFHIEATESSSATNPSDLPDISNVIANSNADNNINSNANNNIADEHVVA